MRKIRFRVLIKIVAASIAIGIVGFVFFIHVPEIEKKEKILIIERSIRSAINQDVCRLPNLPIDNPEIMKFYKNVSKINCGESLNDWVECKKSICYVKPEVMALRPDVTCSYTDIIRKTDYKFKYGETTKTKEPYILLKSDFVKVVCHDLSGDNYYGMAAGIRAEVPQTTYQKSSSEGYLNVLILGFDSLSNNAFKRKLPKTYSFLKDNLHSVILKGYNIVGDGTPQALIPLLTGYTELEMPETRKRMLRSEYVDVYPFIWREFSYAGYYTSFNEDVPKVGTFTYRLNGFKEQPVHHYLRTFYLEAENILSGSKPNCIGHRPDHLIMLDYTMNFMMSYKEKPRFIFSFHGGLSHDNINLIGAADDDVLEWLKTLKSKELLNDSILIMLSDHGNRFSEVRSTLQGKQEERLPFVSFSFPPAFEKRFPKEMANFKENAERLTTPFDLHATFIHLLELQNSSRLPERQKLSVPVSKLAKSRAISLFSPIPAQRSCADAYIEPHWCACLNWKMLSLNESINTGILLKAAASIVNTLNEVTKDWRHLCEPLELQRINWAMRLAPNANMLQFKKNSDSDGFLADMSDNTRLYEVLYQLQIVVSPGDSLFEASVSYSLETLTMQTKISQISRVNKYGSQADCIYERNPELRKFCFCRKTL